MKYTEATPSYNERRYGKPWMAIISTSLTKDFEFLEWDGRPGCAGLFSFEAEPGTMLAYGQKDHRKGRGGVDGYQLCMPDGTLPTIASNYAAEYRQLTPEARWKRKANAMLKNALKENTLESNRDAQRLAKMLGLPDPIMEHAARAFGLIQDEPVAVCGVCGKAHVPPACTPPEPSYEHNVNLMAAFGL